MQWILANSKEEPTVESVTANMENILKKEYLKEIFSYKEIKMRTSTLTIESSDEAMETKWIRVPEKTALFTDGYDSQMRKRIMFATAHKI